MVHVHALSNVYLSEIGDGTTVAAFAEVGGAIVGRNCKIGMGAFLCPGVVLADDVFIAPNATFTNVLNPRAFISRKDAFRKTTVRTGASIGANATVVCGVTIGEYAMIGAGSVVTKNVEPYSLVIGNPARHVKFIDREGNLK